MNLLEKLGLKRSHRQRQPERMIFEYDFGSDPEEEPEGGPEESKAPPLAAEAALLRSSLLGFRITPRDVAANEFILAATDQILDPEITDPYEAIAVSLPRQFGWLAEEKYPLEYEAEFVDVVLGTLALAFAVPGDIGRKQYLGKLFEEKLDQSLARRLLKNFEPLVITGIGNTLIEPNGRYRNACLEREPYYYSLFLDKAKAWRYPETIVAFWQKIQETCTPYLWGTLIIYRYLDRCDQRDKISELDDFVQRQFSGRLNSRSAVEKLRAVNGHWPNCCWRAREFLAQQEPEKNPSWGGFAKKQELENNISEVRRWLDRHKISAEDSEELINRMNMLFFRQE